MFVQWQYRQFRKISKNIFHEVFHLRFRIIFVYIENSFKHNDVCKSIICGSVTFIHCGIVYMVLSVFALFKHIKVEFCNTFQLRKNIFFEEEFITCMFPMVPHLHSDLSTRSTVKRIIICTSAISIGNIMYKCTVFTFDFFCISVCSRKTVFTQIKITFCKFTVT